MTVSFHGGILDNHTFTISPWLFIQLIYMQKFDVSHILDKSDMRAQSMQVHINAVQSLKKEKRVEGVMKNYQKDDYKLIDLLAKEFGKV